MGGGDIENYRVALGQKIPITLKKNLKAVLHFVSKDDEIANFELESGEYKYYFSLKIDCIGQTRRAALVLNSIFYLDELGEDYAKIEVHCSCSRSRFMDCISRTITSGGSILTSESSIL
jgi:hypothetical protein